MNIIISTDEYSEKVDTKFLVNEEDMQIILDFLMRLHEEKSAKQNMKLNIENGRSIHAMDMDDIRNPRYKKND